MASSRVDFGSCVLNRPSKFITTTRYEKTNNGGYLHSYIAASSNSGNTCADFESEILKTQNNVDLSWLPNIDDDNKASESHHHSGEIDFDYSWLPDHFDTKRNGSTAAAKSSNSNRSRETETENDSWLPSTPMVNGGDDDSWLPNYNDVKRNSSTIPSKTENDSNYSSVSSTHTVTYANQSKETNNYNKHKKSKNHDDWKRAHELVFSGDQQIQHAKPLNKEPESSKSDRCSVETDSLGGVSTLCRRFQDLVESNNTCRKAKSSSGTNHSKSPLVITEGNTNNPPGSPSIFFDASDGVASPSTNDLFGRICHTWDHKQVAGGKTRLIRGREAFNDFLNVTEQDKQRELESLAQRKPVSQFPYRARIRALLRARLVKLGATNNQDLESTTTSNQSAKGIKHRYQITKLRTPVNEVVDKTHEIDSSSHSTQVPKRSDCDKKGLDDDNQLENFHDCISEYSESQSDWEEEEEEDDDDLDMEPSHDWISDIVRPKSYWECLRQARYKEMLHLYSDKQDIRDLLERRRVTGFLSSGLRGMIDQLIVGRTQGMELGKQGMEEEDDESRIESKYREYNEFINQRSSSIVSCC